MTDLEELGEEEMLMRAIAMSLDEEGEEEKGVAEEELSFIRYNKPGEVPLVKVGQK